MCSASVLPESNSPATLATVPEVYISAAVSPTMRPMARMMPDKMPGTAVGSTMHITVLSLPAPKPKLPSRYKSGTESRASSVVRIISGRIIIASVSAPESIEKPRCSLPEKNSMPNKP